jgi:hypothetical protein
MLEKIKSFVANFGLKCGDAFHRMMTYPDEAKKWAMIGVDIYIVIIVLMFFAEILKVALLGGLIYFLIWFIKKHSL